MVRVSLATLMSVGVVHSTLTEEDLAALALADARVGELSGPTVLDEKVGFDLGWDYACFLGWHPEDETDKHFLGGFSSAKRKASSLAQVDRHLRKWLQLRYGAWRRNRVFDNNVTPHFLRLIDRPMCPVLRTALTHSTGDSTDWSVDRLNNAGGYAVGNLAVISTKANAAKGARNFFDIEALAALPGTSEGLTQLEWRRLLSLITGPYSIVQGVELLYPLCISPPPLVPLNFFQELQLAIAKELVKKPSKLLENLRRILPSKASARQFQKIVHKAKQSRQKDAPIMEIWLKVSVFDGLKEFYQGLSPSILALMRCMVEAELGTEPVSDEMRKSWALENKGFL